VFNVMEHLKKKGNFVIEYC